MNLVSVGSYNQSSKDEDGQLYAFLFQVWMVPDTLFKKITEPF
jgi:hypothetical protein